jgi:hypothetical protein
VKKRIILAVTAAGILAGGGLWWLAKRPQGGALRGEADRPLFEAAAQGPGTLYQVNPTGPLRTLTWLRPLPGGRSLCFLATQADQQALGLFQDGALKQSFALPLPEGVDASFYRKATPRDAAFAGPLLYLLMGDEDHLREPALLLCLDAATGALKWSHRAPAQRLALAGDQVCLYGPGVPLLRVGLRGKAVEAAPLELPLEVKAPEALLPLEGKGLLLVHRGGLSALLPEGGWRHTPLPPTGPLAFPGAHAALVRTGKSLWWQPRPGQLFEVDAQGALLREVQFPPAGDVDPAKDLDRGLLALLGADEEGRLWFGLAAPDLSRIQAPAGDPRPKEEGWSNEAPAAAPSPAAPSFTEETRAALEAHLKLPMDRLYRLSKDGLAFTRVVWSERWPALQAPADLAPPQGDGALAPEGGAFLLGDGLRRWSLPLKAVAP